MTNNLIGFAPALAKEYSRGLNTGKFPDAWKQAFVTPVLKKGDKKLMLINGQNGLD